MQYCKNDFERILEIEWSKYCSYLKNAKENRGLYNHIDDFYTALVEIVRENLQDRLQNL